MHPMTKLFPLLTAAAAAISSMLISVEPAAAQWGSYGLSRPQLQHQRGNGWSSGDYFGPPRQPRLQQPQPYGGAYMPGLQHNVRYRPGSCAMYISC
jgi:hypothetical protein